MTNVRRIYVEKRKEYATEAHEIQTNLVEQLGLIHFVLFIVMMYKELVKKSYNKELIQFLLNQWWIMFMMKHFQ